MFIKKLIETRNDLLAERDTIVNKAETETRAFEDVEITRMDEIREEVKKIDKSIAELEGNKEFEKRSFSNETTKEEEETRAFESFIRGQLAETRAGEQNLTMGNNGAIIPTTIAKRIIKKVNDICPILAKATIYQTKGKIKIPVWGEADGHNIAVGYHKEFEELTANSGKFTSVDLDGFLVGALILIGKSVIQNADIDVVEFVVNEMAARIAEFIEGQLLVGTGTEQAQGITATTNTLTTGAAIAITADELIDLQARIKQTYQDDACWILHSSTFTAIKKLKDGNGNYLLQKDITGGFPYMLLSKPVYLSDNMPTIAAGNKTVVYGDLSALSVNFRENVQIQVLREKYSTQHAVGINAWFEFDSKVTDSQKAAVLIQKAA